MGHQTPPAVLEAPEESSVAYLGDGLVWVCCRLDGRGRPYASDAKSLAAIIAKAVNEREAKKSSGSGHAVPVDVVEQALVGLAGGEGSPGRPQQPLHGGLPHGERGRGRSRWGASLGHLHDPAVQAFVPEAMEELGFCTWDGDGHFDMSLFPRQDGLPTLGQIVTFLRMADAGVAAGARLTLQLSSPERRAAGAVLAGAALVLRHGCKAQVAWEELLRGSTAPTVDPALAWDRFLLPFGRGTGTTASSLRVLDCLEGLQVARDLGWFPTDYRTFDVEEWSLLRRKFDATWLIPGELVAMANPAVSGDNPEYPGLLDAYDKISVDSESTAATSTFTVEEAQSNPSSPQGALAAQKADAASLCTSEGQIIKQSTFCSYLHHKDVGLVLRLNLPEEVEDQDEYLDVFSKAAFNLQAFEFSDGQVPDEKLCRSFIRRIRQHGERHHQAVAVHCKAGLGRTGVMVGAYVAAHYNVSGKAFHGWVRLCRPGSVQSPQQERFLRRLGQATQVQHTLRSFWSVFSGCTAPVWQ